MTTTSHQTYETANATRRLPQVRAANRFREGIILLLRVLDRQRQRRALLDLDDRLLNDIGKSRREARDEARKPFWK